MLSTSWSQNPYPINLLEPSTPRPSSQPHHHLCSFFSFVKESLSKRMKINDMQLNPQYESLTTTYIQICKSESKGHNERNSQFTRKVSFLPYPWSRVLCVAPATV